MKIKGCVKAKRETSLKPQIQCVQKNLSGIDELNPVTID